MIHYRLNVTGLCPTVIDYYIPVPGGNLRPAGNIALKAALIDDFAGGCPEIRVILEDRACGRTFIMPF